MELLIRSLEEKQRAEAYEQIRTAVAFLEPRSDIGNGFFPHAPQPLRPDATYRYRHEPQDLLRAHGGHGRAQRAASAAEALEFSGHRRLRAVSRDKKGRTGAQAAADARRGEILRAVPRQPARAARFVATFLAVLELCRVHSVRLEDGDDDLNIRFCKMPEERVEHGTDGAGTGS